METKQEILDRYHRESLKADLRLRHQLQDDVSARRHGGNEQSALANERNKYLRSEQRQEVLRLIQECPRTMKEVARLMGVGFNQISGRGTELKRMGLVRLTGEVRHGSAVLEAV